MELAVKWWFGSQSRWVQKAWSATCNLRKPDELYVLGCSTALWYTGVYFWMHTAQPMAQPVESPGNQRSSNLPTPRSNQMHQLQSQNFYIKWFYCHYRSSFIYHGLSRSIEKNLSYEGRVKVFN